MNAPRCEAFTPEGQCPFRTHSGAEWENTTIVVKYRFCPFHRGASMDDLPYRNAIGVFLTHPRHDRSPIQWEQTS